MAKPKSSAKPKTAKIAVPKLALIGAGSMGEALLKGFLASPYVLLDSVVITGRREDRLQKLAKTYGCDYELDNQKAVAGAAIVVLAVKPQILAKVAREIAVALPKDVLLVSVAAGITTTQIEAWFNRSVRVCRAMPNTPVLVCAGCTAICTGSFASPVDVQLTQALFRSVGEVHVVEEGQMDGVTGLSGSGPAYVFTIIEALADAGVKVGLPRYQAQAMAAQTVLGSAKLLLESGEHPGVLKDRVTSPGGTAIAGLHTLEQGGLRTTLINAVVSATERSRELGLIVPKEEK